MCDNLGEWKRIPLSESPYFKSYSTDDRKLFNQYREVLRKFSPTFDTEINWAGFCQLAKSLKKGINPKRMQNIQIEDGVVLNGQHRLAILLALHGPGFEV